MWTPHVNQLQGCLTGAHPSTAHRLQVLGPIDWVPKTCGRADYLLEERQ